MRVDSVGVTLEDSDKVRTWVSRAENWACLVIAGRRTQHEIRMGRVHVETLLAQLPDVLASMALTANRGEACRNAEIASERILNPVAEAFVMASQADAAGAPEVARSLREAANSASSATNAVEVAVWQFEEASAAADSATDSLLYVLREAGAVMQEPTDSVTLVVDANDQAGKVGRAEEPDATDQSAKRTIDHGHAVPRIGTSDVASSSDQESIVHNEPVPMAVAARRLLDRGTWTSSPVPAAPTFTRTWPDGSVDTLLLVGPGGVTYGRRDDHDERLVWQLDGPLREVAPALNALAAPGTPEAPSTPLADPRSEIK